MKKRLPTVPLPGLNREVSRLALGALPFGWTLDRRASFRLLDAFHEAGGNLIDTSDNYSTWAPDGRGGESESIIGAWLSGRRPEPPPLLASKVGYGTPLGQGLGPAHLFASAEASLRRLGVDAIDIYQLHLADPDTSPAETCAALAELRQRDLIRAVGFCNMRAEELGPYLDAAVQAGLAPLVSYQGKLNYIDRNRVSPALYELVKRHGLAFLVYGVLARGFLTGKYARPLDPTVSVRGESVCRKYGRERELAALDRFLAETRSHGRSPVHGAYRWVMNELQENGIEPVVIGGFTSNGQLDEAVAIMGELG